MDTGMDAGVTGVAVYAFGRFRLDPIARILTHDGTRQALSVRLFDTLLYLVQNHGRLIGRDELLQAVWPGRAVEEGNLARAISSLRLALKAEEDGGALIVTVPGRGYRFGGHVSVEEAATPPAPDTASQASTPRATTPLAPRRIGVPAIGAALICLIAIWFAVRGSSGPAAAPFSPPPHSIAVLPFANLGGDPKDAYFSDGLSEELISSLGRIGALHVAAGRSSFSFKGHPASIATIARQLNVGAILEGSVQRGAGAVRIDVELIDAVSGYQLWAQSYDRAERDVLAVQRDTAEAVLRSLRVILVGHDMANLVLGGTANARAFDAYLTGMAALRDSHDNASQAAIGAFDDAIRHDPAYALAYARRSRALAYRFASGLFPDAASRQQVLIKARKDAEKAIALAPDLGAGHAALAVVLKFGLADMAQALAEIQRAVDLSPSDAEILIDYGFIEVELGHFDAAVAAGQRAASLDPLTARTYLDLALILSDARHYEDALVALRRSKALHPEANGLDYGLYGFTAVQMGDYDSALRICVNDKSYYDLACMALADQAVGKQQAADAALAKLHAMLGQDGAYAYAHIAAKWGRGEEALKWLALAYELRDAGLVFMRIDPALEKLHGDPVYRDISHRLGFPP